MNQFIKKVTDSVLNLFRQEKNSFGCAVSEKKIIITATDEATRKSYVITIEEK